jgi:hypothetical protein
LDLFFVGFLGFDGHFYGRNGLALWDGGGGYGFWEWFMSSFMWMMLRIVMANGKVFGIGKGIFGMGLLDMGWVFLDGWMDMGNVNT